MFRRIFNPSLYIGFIIAAVAAAIYVLLLKQTSDLLIDQMLRREQSAIGAGAEIVNVFISSVGFQNSTFARRISIVTPNPDDTPKALMALIDGWKDTPISGAVVTDDEGEVLYGYDRLGSIGQGINVSERDYFKWAKKATEGEEYVGTPIISKIGFANGRYIVPVASPVIKNGRFVGVMVISFLADEIPGRYLNSLKISDETRIYLIDQNGTIVSSPIQQLIGINYLDYISQSGAPDKERIVQTLKASLASEKEGNLDITLPDEIKGGVSTRFLIAYTPITAGSAHWVLAIATPAQEALVYAAPFYWKNLGVVALAFIIFAAATFYIARRNGYGFGGEKKEGNE